MADHEWGGRDKLDFALRNGECWVIEKGGKEFVEWMATPEDEREGGLQRFGIKCQRVGPEALRKKNWEPSGRHHQTNCCVGKGVRLFEDAERFGNTLIGRHHCDADSR